jgi:hypothetical protein
MMNYRSSIGAFALMVALGTSTIAVTTARAFDEYPDLRYFKQPQH